MLGHGVHPGKDTASITVVGAGIAGLTAAWRLSQAGYRVTVFERDAVAGGLAQTFDASGEPLEVFYHHLFTSDTAYVELARELGLEHTIAWLPSRMGMWSDKRLWDFGTPGSLLRFRPLRFSDKVRFVLGTLRLQRTARPESFENITAAEWIKTHEGPRVWDAVWGPLFHQKFASEAEKVAMVWLWGKLRLRGSSRTRSGMGERLGYMEGSFARLTNALVMAIDGAGGAVRLKTPVQRIERAQNGFNVMTDAGTQRSDRVILAVQIPDYLTLAGHLLPAGERERLGRLRATGALCTVLEMSHPLSPYYWLNIADRDLPFGGLIEHTNFIPPGRYGGRHILYISNYLLPEDPLMNADERQVLDLYLPALKRINPDFRPSWILASHHFRAAYAQPIVTTGYRQLIPAYRTPVTGLYLASMAQIFPEDRGQNYAVVSGDRVAAEVMEDLAESPTT
ncbi:MAG: NAD(P)/FAD-dependent oxidoreductase [Acidobacteria bacterium]|nr:NAD(P)/FAD-dependent oxidoreductase [Acidobacteriota bacterium]